MLKAFYSGFMAPLRDPDLWEGIGTVCAVATTLAVFGSLLIGIIHLGFYAVSF